jgi:hypothetical protein
MPSAAGRPWCRSTEAATRELTAALMKFQKGQRGG